MIKDLIWVGLGGFIGSALRYYINVRLLNFNWPIPWPTLAINLSGSLLIGILMALTIRDHQIWRLMIIAGFCGGFTTFSTLSYENLQLLREGYIQIALIYILSSLIGGLICVSAGFLITQKLLT